MSETMRHPDDCYIVRDSYGVPELVDSDGKILFVGRASWTDNDMWRILGIMNSAYSYGFDDGMAELARRIRV